MTASTSGWPRLHWLAILALLAGCQTSPLSLPPLSPVAGTAAEPRVSGAVLVKNRPQPVFEARGREPPPAGGSAAAGSAAGQAGDVTLNFVDTDIREIARVILGTTLKLNYTIDPSVHGTATLDTGTPLARDQLLPVLETLLNQNAATLVKRSGIYAVVPISSAMATNAVAGATPGTGSQVVVLRYASAKDLAKVLEPYVGEGGKLAADSGRNALIVSGDSAVRQTLVGLIRAFDVDTLAGQSFAIFPTGDSDPTKAAAELERALEAEKEGPEAGLVRVIPLTSVNAVLVASPQPRYLDTAKRLFRLTQRAVDATARTWHVYYAQNTDSADLANLLQRAFTPRNVTPITPPGATAPGIARVQMGGGSIPTGLGGTSATGGTSLPGLGGGPATTGGLGGAGGGLGAGLAAATGGTATPPPATEALSTESGPGAGEGANQMRIVANPRNNAVLIYATPNEYAMVEGMLRKVDIIPLEVLVDATIAEVDLNGALQYGTQFFFKLDHVAETLGAVPTPFPPNPLAPTGLTGFALTKSPHFILQALSDVTKVRVLSAPQLLVMDSEPARLQVGQEVPILTGTATSTLTAGAPVVNSVDYHSTGVIMQVTPRINSGGLVTLDIAQEVSDVATAATNTVQGSPTFDDRVLTTRVAVHDGQTVALAGLIHDNESNDNNGIPFLKDVPVLSTLLSSQSSTRNRTELLVLITPHIVRNERDARSLTEDLRNQLINSGLVPAELQRRPLPGLANPNGL